MSKRDLQEAREVKGVPYVGYEAWWSTPGEGSRGGEESGRAAVESGKDRRWRIRGPGRAREGAAPGRWRRIGGCRLFVEGCIVALLHGCTERSTDGLLDQGGGRRSSGPGWSSSGGGGGPAAGLRQAQALPWPWEMRLAQNGGLRTRVCLRGTRVQARMRRKIQKKKSKKIKRKKEIDAGARFLNGDTEGNSRSCQSSSRGYLIRELASRSHFGVDVPVGPNEHTEVGCLTAGRTAVVDELGVFLYGHVGYDADAVWKE